MKRLTGAGYHIFAGKEVSRALAKMSLVEEDCNDKLDDLTKHQLETLTEWETKFQEKYEVVGKVYSIPCYCAPWEIHYGPADSC